jgi:uncharacterized membrane protein HdeD (DUF308 family)
MTRSLRNLYLCRVAFSALWVSLVYSLGVPTSQGLTVSAFAGLLLVAYPISDLTATIVDLRAAATGQSTTWPQRVNAGVGAVAAITIGIAALVGLTSAMNVFAGWAIVSGIIQLTVGARRLGRLRGQWLMIISGAGSIFAGTTFIGWNHSAADALHVLAQYSIGGAVWYLLTAIWLTRPLTQATKTVLRDP